MGAPCRGAGLPQRPGAAGAKGGGVGAGIDLDPVGVDVVHRCDRSRIGIDKQNHPAAERLQLGERGVDQAVLAISSFQPSSEVKASGQSGTRVHCSGLTAATMSRKRRSG
jgi:hypothetical protein